MTANQVTQQAIEYLNLNGHLVWRNNQIPVRGRTFTGLKGVSDIIGLTRLGRFIAVEVKVDRDKQSDAQKVFEAMVKKRRGIYIIIHDVNDLTEAGL